MGKISQQMYTRAPRTLFSQSPGYGTVAISEGLDEAFVRERVQPYCRYPDGAVGKVYTVVQYPCGRMLFGQASFVAKDFTGTRSTFFAHNYVLSGMAVSDVLSRMGELQRGVFCDAWQGEALGALEDIPLGDIKDVNICIPPEIFSHVSGCVTKSVYSGQKTYVLLPTGIQNPEAYTWALLSGLYSILPWDVKHRLGFCTYVTEPIGVAGIHLAFMDRARAKAFHMADDFVIDLDVVVDSTPELSAQICGYQRLCGHVSGLPLKLFFQTLGFWQARNCSLPQAEAAWLQRNLDTFTMAQLKEIPDSFVKQGKLCYGNEIYVLLEILKQGATTQGDFSHVLGSYALSCEGRLKVVERLTALGMNHDDLPKFLFRVSTVLCL